MDNFVFLVFCLIFIQQVTPNILECTWGNDKWTCEPRNVFSHYTELLPEIQPVEHCVPFDEFRLVINNALTHPSNPLTWLNLIEPNKTGQVHVLNCTDLNGPCTCEDNECEGTEVACTFMACTKKSHEPNRCFCNTTPVHSTLVAVKSFEDEGSPFRLLKYKTCIPRFLNETRPKREVDIKLQPMKSMTIHQHEIFVPYQGKLVLRKNGIEYIHQVDANSTIKLPYELSVFSGNLLALLITNNGDIISDEFILTGITICEKLPCLFCIEALQKRQCLPTTVLYIIYGFAILLTLFVIIYLQTAIKSILQMILWTVYCGQFIWKKSKQILRFFFASRPSFWFAG